MELVGAISAREWNSLSGIYSSDQEADHRHNDNQFIMASHDDFLADHHHHSVVDQNYLQLTNGASSLENPFPIFTSEGSTSHYLSGIFADSYHNSSNTSNIYAHDQPLTLVKHNSAPLALCDDSIVTRNVDLFLNIEGDHRHQCLNQDMMSNNGNYGGNNQPAAVYNATLLHKEVGMESGSRSRNYMKRSRSTPAEHGQNKRNVRPRKSCTQKLPMSDNEEDANVQGPISPNSSCSAGEHSYEELGGIDLSSSTPKGFPALNLHGKARATRGSATDPQSVYSRKRREKINERLKILQNLVPNGTKVDISTMLEEAVQYVKFLQLQIKLLSSDDLWMYAPLAYNGMDIGLDFNISATPRE